MYLSRDQYTAAGYTAIPADTFPRWARAAEQTVRRYTFDRISDADITETNRAGVCEIADALYAQHMAVTGGENGQAVTSFSNQHYSESYASAQDTQAATSRTIAGIMRDYFTAAQLCRWI